MTEEEWLMAREPQGLLRYLRQTHGVGRSKAGRRRLRLVSCGCCRLIWKHLNNKLQQAVEISERYADNSALAKEIQAAREAAEPSAASYSADSPHAQESTTVALAWATTRQKPIEAALYSMCWPMPLAGHVGPPDIANGLICHIIRDIFGNPFRSVTLNPTWRTSTVLALANGIYQEKAFDRMPILADALQEASLRLPLK